MTEQKPDHISCRPGTTDAMQRLAERVAELESRESDLETENKRLKHDLKAQSGTIEHLKQQRNKAREDALRAQIRAASAGDKARIYKHQMLAERKLREDIEHKMENEL